ncbi:hypothetical protein V6U90_27130 [Micromonospora sp. CPCC 206060]
MASRPARFTLATGLTCCLGFAAFTGSAAFTRPEVAPTVLPDVVAERAAAAGNEAASRSLDRSPLPSPSATSPTPTPSITATPTRKPPAPRKPTRPARPKPVAGLTQAQMDNAKVIVDVGRGLDVPRHGLIVAIATAMQESTLYNLANDYVPESFDHPHQGSGADHDSVGLFQQRPSSGWGSVEDLMRPAYAARQFYLALLEILGWQDMSVAGAAQAVQVSAFPDAYAQHEERAGTVVSALT